MNKISFGDRLRYRFDNIMSRGTIALVGALFAGTFLLILVGTLILVLARLKPAGGEALSFTEALWQVTMRTVDTGTVAGDTGWSYRLVGFAITLGGIFIVERADRRLGQRSRGPAQRPPSRPVVGHRNGPYSHPGLVRPGVHDRVRAGVR